MPAAFPIRWQIDWRLESTNQRLAVALAISLVLHGLAYTGWKVAPATIAFFKEAFERVVPAPRTAKQPELEKPTPPPPREVPMVFVEIDPALATPEPPKETRNYSTANSIAANPQPKKAEVPKIDGSQAHVMSSAEPSKPQPKPLQPTPPQPKPPEPKPPEPKPEETKAPEKPVEPKPKPPEVKPKAPPPPGDLALAKATPKAPELTPNSDAEKPAPKPRERPRTLQEARARNPSLAVEQTKQDGGVEQQAQVAMFDARGSVFGEYDSVFVSMVRTRWYQLLNENKYMMDRRGKVTLTFRIYHDGRVSDPSMLENTVGDMLSLLCMKAVLDPAPFPKWPQEMRRQIKLQSNAESREVRFTFYYD